MRSLTLHVAPRVGWPWVLVMFGDLRGWSFPDGRRRRVVHITAGRRRAPTGAGSHLGAA